MFVTGIGDGLPSAGMIADFTRVCDEFFKKDSASAIGVFDEFGCNRSLFLIAHYMIHQRGISVEDAIAMSKLFRPPCGLYEPAALAALGVSDRSPSAPAWDTRTAEEKLAWHAPASEQFKTQLLTNLDEDSGAVMLDMFASAAPPPVAPPAPPISTAALAIQPPLKRARPDAANPIPAVAPPPPTSSVPPPAAAPAVPEFAPMPAFDPATDESARTEDDSDEMNFAVRVQSGSPFFEWAKKMLLQLLNLSEVKFNAADLLQKVRVCVFVFV